MRFIGPSTIVLTLLVSGPASAGTWTQQFQQPGSDTATIAIAAATEARAVAFGMEPDGQGNSRTVWLKTSDGQKWNKEVMGGADLTILSDLACSSDTRCWAVGTSINMQTMGIKNLLMGSVSGGESWFVAPPLDYAVSGIAPKDEDDLWLVGGTRIIPIVGGKTQTWIYPKVNDDWFSGILDASFVGDQTVFAVNGESETDDNGNEIGILPKGALLRSDDGGSTWTALFRDRPEKPTHVRFITDKVGFMMGEAAGGSFIRRTDDGGVSWLDIVLPTPAAVPVPTFLGDWVIFNSRAGLILGSDKDANDQSFHVVYRMKDGHTLSEDQLPDNKGALFTMACAGQKACWIAGENHVIRKFEGTDADVVPEGPAGSDASPMPDKAGTDLAASEWAAGQDAAAGEVEGGADGSAGGDSSGSCAAGLVGARSSGWQALLLVLAFLALRRRIRGA